VFSLTYHFNMHLEKFYGPENRENMFLWHAETNISHYTL
jgi:hypothetical protein